PSTRRGAPAPHDPPRTPHGTAERDPGSSGACRTGPRLRSRTDRSDPWVSRAGFLGLVDQHDGDRDAALVADRIDVATLSDARDDLFLLPILDLAAAVRTDQDVEQLLVERHLPT